MRLIRRDYVLNGANDSKCSKKRYNFSELFAYSHNRRVGHKWCGVCPIFVPLRLRRSHNVQSNSICSAWLHTEWGRNVEGACKVGVWRKQCSKVWQLMIGWLNFRAKSRFVVCRLVNLLLPPSAKGRGVSFRWWQPTFGGADRVDWAINNLAIGGKHYRWEQCYFCCFRFLHTRKECSIMDGWSTIERI